MVKHLLPAELCKNLLTGGAWRATWKLKSLKISADKQQEDDRNNNNNDRKKEWQAESAHTHRVNRKKSSSSQQQLIKDLCVYKWAKNFLPNTGKFMWTLFFGGLQFGNCIFCFHFNFCWKSIFVLLEVSDSFLVIFGGGILCKWMYVSAFLCMETKETLLLWTLYYNGTFEVH